MRLPLPLAEAENLCPRCGAYWRCDCLPRRMEPPEGPSLQLVWPHGTTGKWGQVADWSQVEKAAYSYTEDEIDEAIERFRETHREVAWYFETVKTERFGATGR